MRRSQKLTLIKERRAPRIGQNKRVNFHSGTTSGARGTRTDFSLYLHVPPSPPRSYPRAADTLQRSIDPTTTLMACIHILALHVTLKCIKETPCVPRFAHARSTKSWRRLPPFCAMRPCRAEAARSADPYSNPSVPVSLLPLAFLTLPALTYMFSSVVLAKSHHARLPLHQEQLALGRHPAVIDIDVALAGGRFG